METDPAWVGCSRSPLLMNSKPRNRANLSPVWKHFTRIGDARSCLGSCLHCGTEVAVPGGSTTGMFSHLNVHHPQQYRQAKDLQQSFVKPLSPISAQSPSRVSPIDLRSGIHRAFSSPFLPLSQPQHYHHFSPQKVVSVKPLEPKHVQLCLFPFMFHSYCKLQASPQLVESESENNNYDLVIHCRGGVVLANRLLLAAVSHFVRQLLEESSQAVDHLIMADINLDTMQRFVKSIYSGTLDFKDESLTGIFDLFGIPYRFKEPQPPFPSGEDGSYDDIGSESDEADGYLEPMLQLDEGNTSLDTELTNPCRAGSPPEGFLSAEFDTLASESDIEAKAQELKDKIFAECGLVSKKNKMVRNTRNPSKIWKWFTKTPAFIYCKICGLGIKNSGNTTNASSHLKRHPEQYADFKMEISQQHLETLSENNETDGIHGQNVEEEYDRLVWKYFQTSKKSNRKAKCYLCGKDTPMGSSNVLLHLKHHHPSEHSSIVKQLARKKTKNLPEPDKPVAGLMTVVKTEPLDTEDHPHSPVNIKVEIEET